MEVPFARLLVNNTRLFQQVIRDYSANRIRFIVKLNVHVLAETRRVVVSIGLGVAECLQNGVALNEHVFHPKHKKFTINVTKILKNIQQAPLDLILATGVCDRSNVLHDDLRCLGFAGTGFTGDHDAGITIPLLDRSIGGVGNGEHVWRILE